MFFSKVEYLTFWPISGIDFVDLTYILTLTPFEYTLILFEPLIRVFPLSSSYQTAAKKSPTRLA